MARVALVGLGVIAKSYKSGLTSSKALKLVAVCDVCENAPSRQFYSNYPFYKDYKEMIDREKPDYIIIATPPKTHLDITAYANTKGIGVFLEKPAVVNKNELLALNLLPNAEQAPVLPMLHWMHSAEVLEFCRLYDKKLISEIKVSIKHPYSADGITIKPDRQGLMGCWLDSGVNVLAYLMMLLPFNNVKILEKTSLLCENTNLPLFFDVKMLVDDIPVQIIIDWREEIECKESVIGYDGRNILLRHSKQELVDHHNVISLYEQDRLSQHYQHLFSDPFKSKDTIHLYKLYDMLFEIGEEL